MATTSATQAESNVTSRNRGPRRIRVALAAGVAALGLATRLGLGHYMQVAPEQPVLTADKNRGGY